MLRRLKILMVLLGIGTTLTGPTAWSQQSDAPQQNDNGNFRRGDRGSQRGGGRRGSMRGRNPTSLTAEERSEMYDRMVVRYLGYFERDYELSDEQTKMIRGELDVAKEEHLAYSEPLREEFESLMNEMHELINARRDGGEGNPERMHELGGRLRELREKSPLMNMGTVRERIEAKLPEDQVARARARMNEHRSEWETMRRMRRDAGESGRGPGDFRRRDSWERYYDEFVAMYELDESQVASAQSVYRDYVQQRETYRKEKAEAYEVARQLKDRAERSKEFEKLNSPIDHLFETLKQKLDQVPTSTQKVIAESRRATTEENRSRRRGRPSSRPASSPTSKPAGEEA